MNHEMDLGGQNSAFSNKETAENADIKAHTMPIDRPLIHNERISVALAAIQQGRLGPYDPFELSCSYYKNPAQIVLRNQETGRLKIANIDSQGGVAWDADEIPWYKVCH